MATLPATFNAAEATSPSPAAAVTVPSVKPEAVPPARLMALTRLSASVAVSVTLPPVPWATVSAGQVATIGWLLTVPQTVSGEAVLCGVGAPVEKSALLSSVSMQTLVRMAAVVLLSTGAAALPSKWVAEPKPTRST